jgi:uncharacterized protein YaaN involved in tellurite resistance
LPSVGLPVSGEPGVGEPAHAEVEAAEAVRLDALAESFAHGLANVPVNGPAYRRAIGQIDRLGDRDTRLMTAIAARFQDRPRQALDRESGERGPVADHLARLRKLVESVASRAAGPAFEGRVRGLIASLDADASALEADNAAIAQEEQALWIAIHGLRSHVYLAERIDGELSGAPEAARAGALGNTDALYATRRRRRDLLQQLAVATQAYAALRLMEQRNLDLVWQLRSAAAATGSALRTAMLVAGTVRSSKARAEAHGLDDAWQEVLAALDAADDRRRATNTAAGESG